ncbi:MAG: STAS domain-containing protein [Phycisphaerae bacterium]|nr:STAS domain-containing protein [Phycisphaerae bacterium]
MTRALKEMRQVGSTTVVVPSGEVDLQRSPELYREMMAICRTRPPRLVVDLRQVSYMDSSGVSTLVEVFRSVNAYGGVLVLLAPTERVRAMFQIAKLDQFFTIVDTEKEALRDG